VSTSLGIAVYPVDGQALADLLREADLAMYRDKARCPAAPSISGSPLGAGLKGGGILSLVGPVEGSEKPRNE
jgi:GGDEF domain-containing protein